MGVFTNTVEKQAKCTLQIGRLELFDISEKPQRV
jgi:hypothetical protein